MQYQSFTWCDKGVEQFQSFDKRVLKEGSKLEGLFFKKSIGKL